MNCRIKSNVAAPIFQLQLSIQLMNIVLLILFSCNAQSQTLNASNKHHDVSSIIVFGDSTVDPGNNNYLDSTTFKSNFPPYGKDFVNHIPTGRFTNGRLVTDFAASYMGLKDYVPPYLDPTLTIQDLTTGLSFASAGSGFDPLTAALGGLISLDSQVEYFRDYIKRLENAIGKERTNVLIKKAVFVASAGTNDFVINYFGSSFRRESYSVTGYQNMLMQNIQQFIQDLLNEGAQNIVIVGLPPLGCLPIVITLYSFNGRECIESFSSIARDYNQLLQINLKKMQNSNSNANIFYADIYDSFNQIIKYPKKHGFDEVSMGCCGTGYIEASYLCNSESMVCSDASKYVFWDSVHPTERAYNIIFNGLHSTIDLVLKE